MFDSKNQRKFHYKLIDQLKAFSSILFSSQSGLAEFFCSTIFISIFVIAVIAPFLTLFILKIYLFLSIIFVSIITFTFKLIIAFIFLLGSTFTLILDSVFRIRIEFIDHAHNLVIAQSHLP